MHSFTVTQMMLAAGLSRGVRPSTLARLLNISLSYISKLKDDPIFRDLVVQMKALPPDSDHKEFHGLSTLYTDAGRMLYNYGTRLVAETRDMEWQGE